VGFLFGSININMITLSILQAINPKTRESTLIPFVDALNEVCDHYSISTTNQRLACFLSQVSHESGGFKYIKENLNYGAQGLRNTFGKYFTTDELAAQYERKPQLIANREMDQNQVVMGLSFAAED
jgi:putative chitinase